MNKYEVKYWIQNYGAYDDKYIIIEANNEQEAIQKAQNSPKTFRGKDFSIYKKLKL